MLLYLFSHVNSKDFKAFGKSKGGFIRYLVHYLSFRAKLWIHDYSIITEQVTVFQSEPIYK